jgi:hypothetical protein
MMPNADKCVFTDINERRGEEMAQENAQDDGKPHAPRRAARKSSPLADSLGNELKELQEEYAKTPYNKATNKHLGILRAKIARVKKGIEDSKKRKGGTGFFVKKSGDATVALVGFPSAGKSSLMNALAGTKSKTADYAFTTTSLIPGMMYHNGAKIQVFDLPGIIEGAHIGAGGGRTVLAAAKMADLIAFVVDATMPEQLDTIMQELRKLDVFINRREPDVHVQSSNNSGFRLEVNRSGLSKKELETIFSGFGMFNSIVKINQEMGEDELIAFLAGRSCYINAIVALNKVDIVPGHQAIAAAIGKRYGLEVVPISATTGYNLAALTGSIYRNLDIMVVYLRPKDSSERTETMVLRSGSTVADAARKIHTELADELKYAYVNGPSAKFRNQRVGATHVLMDGDRVTFKLS